MMALKIGQGVPKTSSSSSLMITLLWVCLAISFESFAVCQKPVISNEHQKLAIGSMERVYRVHVPPGYRAGTDHPVVLMLHGWGGDENTFLDDPNIIEPADARGFVLVVPQGLGSGPPDNNNGSWTFNGSASGVTQDGAPICDTSLTPDYRYDSCKAAGIAENSCAWTHCQNLPSTDAEFLEVLLAEVEALFCVDPARIFVFGGSNGGNAIWDFADRPAWSKKIAAMTSLIGLPHKSYISGDSALRVPPALLITGTQDQTDPPGAWDNLAPTTTSNQADRFYYESASATIRAWSERQGCTVDAKATPLDVPAPFDCRSYCPGSIESSSALDCRIEMGHVYQLETTWPFILDFFLNRPLAGPLPPR